MAGTYPSYPQLTTSVRQVYSPTQWLTSENGTQLAVDLGDRRRKRWAVAHRISGTQFDTLEALYESNQSTSGAGNGSVTFEDKQDGGTNSPGNTYTVEFVSRPVRRWIGPDLYDVQVELEEVG